MLTTLVTRLESSTQYSSMHRLPHLWSLRPHAAVWLKCPTEQGSIISHSPQTDLCDPAVCRWPCVQVRAVGSLLQPYISNLRHGVRGLSAQGPGINMGIRI